MSKAPGLKIFTALLTGLFLMPGGMSRVRADVSQPVLSIPTLDEVECISYCVYDKTDDEIILSKLPFDTVYPASMTKIMTIQLGMDYLDPDDYLITSENAMDNVTSDSTLMGLVAGEEVKVSELYYGMMLPSGNDAANVVAEGVVRAFIDNYPAGGDEVGPDGINASYLEDMIGLPASEIRSDYTLTAFSYLMNYRAQRIGCTGSNFVNPHGLHHEAHYTTASDLTLIMAHAAENPDFCTVISSPTHIFEGTNMHTEDGWSIVRNTNNLLSDPWLACTTAEGEDTHLTAFIGGKTGTTSAAGTGMTVYCVNENGHELFISVCGIPEYAYQTRYVASVVAYGNLACWERDPVTVIPGTTGDYRRFNSTTAELPQFDPLIIPGDSLEGALLPEDTSETDESSVTEQTDVPSEETGAVPDDSDPPETITDIGDKLRENRALMFIKTHLAITVVISLLVIAIITCLVVLIVRSVSNSRKKRRRSARPFKGNPDEFLN